MKYPQKEEFIKQFGKEAWLKERKRLYDIKYRQMNKENVLYKYNRILCSL